MIRDICDSEVGRDCPALDSILRLADRYLPVD
jgi:hypothetical protein